MAKVEIDKPEPIDEYLSLYEQEKNIDIREASQNVFYGALRFVYKHLIAPNYKDLLMPHINTGKGIVYNPAIVCVLLEKYIDTATALDKCATMTGFDYLTGIKEDDYCYYENNKAQFEQYILLNNLDKFVNEEDIPSSNIVPINSWLPDIDKSLYKAISNTPIYNIYINYPMLDLSKYEYILTFSMGCIAKRLRKAYENGIEGKLLTGKQNPVGLLGVANYRFGWNQGNGNGQTVNIITQRSADEIASLYGIAPAQIAQAPQKADNEPISTAESQTGAGLPDAMPL